MVFLVCSDLTKRNFFCKSFCMVATSYSLSCPSNRITHYAFSCYFITLLSTTSWYYVNIIIGLALQTRTLTIVNVSWLFLWLCPLEILMLLKTKQTSTRECHMFSLCLLWLVTANMTCPNKILHSSKSIKSCNQRENNLH